MKKRFLALIIISIILTACGNSNNNEIADISNNQTDIKDNEYENILFYGDYELDGNVPDEKIYYDRIVFYPDGKCYVHYINTNDDKSIDRGYYTYEYSFSTASYKIGIGSISGGSGNMIEIPVMSENRTLLKFENYVLKRVDEQ